jgi:1-acyl-sn-glycerol-3-phosphate acyltransferase
MSAATTTPPQTSASRAPFVPTASAIPLAEHDIRSYIRTDPWRTKLARRLVTISLQLTLTIVWWLLIPALLPILALADMVRRTPLQWARFYLMMGLILFGHAWGMLSLFGCWVASGGGRNYERNNRWSIAVQGYWADWNARAQGWVYGITYHVEGAELLRNGPTILLVRHTSINDTILPIALITYPHNVRLRIVLKAELLFAPIVDAIGHRWPTAFIERSSTDPQRELDAVRLIAQGLHADETVMIFPEGTRYTAAKRAKLMDKIADKDPLLAGRAAELTHVLPLRLGGTNALIDAAPDADIVICAHTGYEQTERLEDFVNGGLYRAAVRVKFWRIPAAQIPRNLDERAAFLHAQWRLVNQFVVENQPA